MQQYHVTVTPFNMKSTTTQQTLPELKVKTSGKMRMCGYADVPSDKVRRKTTDIICRCGKMRIWHCGCVANEWLTTFILLRRCLYSRHQHGIFGHWKAVTAIFLTLTLIYRTLCTKQSFKNVKNNHSTGVEPATYVVRTGYR